MSKVNETFQGRCDCINLGLLSRISSRLTQTSELIVLSAGLSNYKCVCSPFNTSEQRGRHQDSTCPKNTLQVRWRKVVIEICQCYIFYSREPVESTFPSDVSIILLGERGERSIASSGSADLKDKERISGHRCINNPRIPKWKNEIVYVRLGWQRNFRSF
ncbi:hypothetical protein CDAR_177341 [Caerostris darwini]|uniref:Uncharacterized protein n=1 Tax=Caerostris darwini TaxID=1538125 RepID=A0AAV4P1L2_9ARAC|nr:hypothetical protein CDAR_177341 [Caerostris darwini]